ncbi:hypothetical protein B0H14DRAFT_2592736 [Mycena olivaceomarginata]|nr:hypothetical protein B0H14DRAFT_2592736 [Mycena olivaceomarginata]
MAIACPPLPFIRCRSGAHRGPSSRFERDLRVRVFGLCSAQTTTSGAPTAPNRAHQRLAVVGESAVAAAVLSFHSAFAFVVLFCARARGVNVLRRGSVMVVPTSPPIGNVAVT